MWDVRRDVGSDVEDGCRKRGGERGTAGFIPELELLSLQQLQHCDLPKLESVKVKY